MIRLFLCGWLIVTLTAMNVAFIAAHAYPLAFVTGFGISFVWYGNTGKASDDRSRLAHVVYASGAACGTATGMWLASLLH